MSFARHSASTARAVRSRERTVAHKEPLGDLGEGLRTCAVGV
jgi:hypothetical protein